MPYGGTPVPQAGLGPGAQCLHAGTPNIFSIDIAGHQLVNADWNRFRPTKPVNRNHYGLK